MKPEEYSKRTFYHLSDHELQTLLKTTKSRLRRVSFHTKDNQMPVLYTNQYLDPQVTPSNAARNGILGDYTTGLPDKEISFDKTNVGKAIFLLR